MDIDRDEQRLRYLSLFAVGAKYSALMSHHETVGDSVVGGVVESWSIAKNIHGIFVPSQAMQSQDGGDGPELSHQTRKIWIVIVALSFDRIEDSGLRGAASMGLRAWRHWFATQQFGIHSGVGNEIEKWYGID
jgi:hypothetical protein